MDDLAATLNVSRGDLNVVGASPISPPITSHTFLEGFTERTLLWIRLEHPFEARRNCSWDGLRSA